MNGTTLERPDVAAYLAAVRAALADLPAEERDELLVDVEAALSESAYETLRRPPAEFAAELREAAGLAAPAAEAPAPVALLERLRRWLGGERAASLFATARELAPIWWLARAYVAVASLALVSGQGWPVGSGTSRTPIEFGQSVVALLVVATVSVWLGLRSRRRGTAHRRLGIAFDLALVLAAAPVAVHSYAQLERRSLGGGDPVAIAAEPVPGLANDGVPVRNIYPYSRSGELLHDVFLYDERGLPLEVLMASDPTRRVLVDRFGEPWFNSFPVRYYEPGTQEVARPDLAPEVRVPDVATPELRPPDDNFK